MSDRVNSLLNRYGTRRDDTGDPSPSIQKAKPARPNFSPNSSNEPLASTRSPVPSKPPLRETAATKESMKEITAARQAIFQEKVASSTVDIVDSEVSGPNEVAETAVSARERIRQQRELRKSATQAKLERRKAIESKPIEEKRQPVVVPSVRMKTAESQTFPTNVKSVLVQISQIMADGSTQDPPNWEEFVRSLKGTTQIDFDKYREGAESEIAQLKAEKERIRTSLTAKIEELKATEKRQTVEINKLTRENETLGSSLEEERGERLKLERTMQRTHQRQMTTKDKKILALQAELSDAKGGTVSPKKAVRKPKPDSETVKELRDTIERMENQISELQQSDAQLLEKRVEELELELKQANERNDLLQRGGFTGKIAALDEKYQSTIESIKEQSQEVMENCTSSQIATQQGLVELEQHLEEEKKARRQAERELRLAEAKRQRLMAKSSLLMEHLGYNGLDLDVVLDQLRKQKEENPDAVIPRGLNRSDTSMVVSEGDNKSVHCYIWDHAYWSTVVQERVVDALKRRGIRIIGDYALLTEQVVELNNELIMAENEISNLRDNLHRQRIGLLLWRSDFLRENEKVTEKKVSLKTSQTRQEMADLIISTTQKADLALRAKEKAETELFQRNEEFLLLQDRLKSVVTTDMFQREKELDELNDLRRDVQELWQKLKTSAKEVASFYMKIDMSLEPTFSILNIYKKYRNELKKMNDIVNRLHLRTNLSGRLSELTQKTSSPTHLFSIGGPEAIMKEEQERSNVVVEILKLDAFLINSIRNYCAEFEKDFYYSTGDRVYTLVTVQNNSNKMVEWAAREGIIDDIDLE